MYVLWGILSYVLLGTSRYFELTNLKPEMEAGRRSRDKSGQVSSVPDCSSWVLFHSASCICSRTLRIKSSLPPSLDFAFIIYFGQIYWWKRKLLYLGIHFLFFFFHFKFHEVGLNLFQLSDSIWFCLQEYLSGMFTRLKIFIQSTGLPPKTVLLQIFADILCETKNLQEIYILSIWSNWWPLIATVIITVIIINRIIVIITIYKKLKRQ